MNLYFKGETINITHRRPDSAGGPAIQRRLAPGAVVQARHAARAAFSLVEVATLHGNSGADRQWLLAWCPASLGAPLDLAELRCTGCDHRRALYPTVGCNESLYLRSI